MKERLFRGSGRSILVIWITRSTEGYLIVKEHLHFEVLTRAKKLSWQN
jgi:hypothetical protein